MKMKSFEMVLLFDFYGDILTEKQREFFDLYYNEDLSLAEIAENEGITRQGVRDAILRAESTLGDMEERLHLFRRYGATAQKMEEVMAAADAILDTNERNFRNQVIRENAEKIREIAARLPAPDGEDAPAPVAVSDDVEDANAV